MRTRIQTRREEFYNTATHAVGVLLCLIGMPFSLIPVIKQQNTLELISVVAFFIGMMLVYSFSSIYHYVHHGARKKTLRKFDHISIYFLIAGTYSPLMMKYLEEKTALIFLGVMWSIVLVGIFYKLFFINRFKWISLVTYLLMGWMVVFVIKPLIHNIPLSVFWWIFAGGVSYTVGVYFYAKSNKKYYHSIWHVFVLLGTVLHFMAIYKSYVPG